MSVSNETNEQTAQVPISRLERFGIPSTILVIVVAVLVCCFFSQSLSDFLSWNKPMLFSVAQGVIVALLGLLGVWMSLDDKASARKCGYIISFVILTVIAMVLIVIQTVRSAPPRPLIFMETLKGLPPSMGRNRAVRLHRLSVINPSQAPIENFCARLQLPEPIVNIAETNSSPGASFDFHAILLRMLVDGEGGRTRGGLWLGGTSTNYMVYPDLCFRPEGKRDLKGCISGAGEITGVWELSISTLPAKGGRVQIEFITSNSGDATNYVEFVKIPMWSSQPRPSKIPDKNELQLYFEGRYDYRSGDDFLSRYFFIPIAFDESQRICQAMKTQTEIGHWHPVLVEFY